MMDRIIVGISGASGVIYGIRMLQILQDLSDIETHLVITPGGKLNISLETDFDLKAIEQLADVVHSNRNLGATIASGSFKTKAMVIIPCSMRTLSGVVTSYANNLIVRAADVVLKEKRQLILVPRETPLHSIHIENMLTLSRMGTTILPPEPAFYLKPSSIDDIVRFVVSRIFVSLQIDSELQHDLQYQQKADELN